MKKLAGALILAFFTTVAVAQDTVPPPARPQPQPPPQEEPPAQEQPEQQEPEQPVIQPEPERQPERDTGRRQRDTQQERPNTVPAERESPPPQPQETGEAQQTPPPRPQPVAEEPAERTGLPDTAGQSTGTIPDSLLVRGDSILIKLYPEENMYFGEAGKETFDIQALQEKEQRLWFFIGIMILLALVAYIRYNHNRYLQILYRSLWSINITQQLYREEQPSITVQNLLTTILFFLSAGLYFYLILDLMEVSLPYDDQTLVAMLIAGVFLFFLFKFIIMKIVSYSFPVKEELHFFMYNLLLVLKLIGVALIPLTIIIAYAPLVVSRVTLILSFVLIAVLFLFLYLRGLAIGRKYLMFNKFHFFLYLCASEIAPVFIVIKIFKEWAAV